MRGRIRYAQPWRWLTTALRVGGPAGKSTGQYTETRGELSREARELGQVGAKKSP